MAHAYPSSSSGDGEKGSYKSYATSGRQSFKTSNAEPNQQQKSFWSVIAKKAKSVLLDDDCSTCTTSDSGVGNKSCEISSLQYAHPREPAESKPQQRGEAPMLQKRLVAFTSSCTIGSAIEEGLNIVETKASDLILSDSPLLFIKKTSETGHRRDNINKSQQGHNIFIKKTSETGHRRDNINKSQQGHNREIRPSTNTDPFIRSLQQEQCFSRPVKQQMALESRESVHANSLQRESSTQKPSQQHSSRITDQSAADKETQIKASRDVAMAMAAKTKLLLRELKEAKADLAMARDRCVQLEEKNRSIRRSLSSGLKPDEEDLVRIQLETLLAEKARLAQENAYYARENLFLLEMIEYHRLTMQQKGGAFLEECMLEVTEQSSDFKDEDTDDLPPETHISTVTS